MRQIEPNSTTTITVAAPQRASHATAVERGRKRSSKLVSGVLLASAALLISACGSSAGSTTASSGSSGPASSGTGSTGSSSNTGASSSASSGTALLSNLTALETHPAFVAPGPAIDAKKLPASTSIVVIDNTPSVGPLQQATEGVLSAAKAAGFTPKLLNGGANNTPSDDIDLLEQAVNDHPSVVLQVGIITQLETAGLQYAKAHGVPVIAVDDNQPVAGVAGEGSGPLVAGAAALDLSRAGKDIADYIAAKGPSNATIGAIESKDIASADQVYAGFTAELKKVCPHCKLVAQNVDTANWTTQITPTVTSMLDANPSMSYLFPDVDGMAPWITPALSASSHKVAVVSVNATPGSAMAAVKSGQFAAEVGTSPIEIGWYAFDAALRVMLKAPSQTNPNEPLTFFTTSEMQAKSLDPNSVTSLFGNSFEAGFKKLWGVG